MRKDGYMEFVLCVGVVCPEDSDEKAEEEQEILRPTARLGGWFFQQESTGALRNEKKGITDRLL
jgi:hypothetical protein